MVLTDDAHLDHGNSLMDLRPLDRSDSALFLLFTQTALGFDLWGSVKGWGSGMSAMFRSD